MNATTYGCIIASLAIGVSSLSWTMVATSSSDALDAVWYSEHGTDDAFPQRSRSVSSA